MLAGGDAGEAEAAVGAGSNNGAVESQGGAGDESLGCVADDAGERSAVGAGCRGGCVVVRVGRDRGLRSRVHDSEAREDGGDEKLMHVCVLTVDCACLLGAQYG